MCGPFMALNARPDPAVFGGDEAGAAKWSRRVERRFEVWGRSPYACDLTMRRNLGQMCAQSVKRWFGVGEICGLVRYKLRPGNTHGTKIQVIPGQRIPQSARQQPSVQGVVLDDDGAAKAYCINSYNPNSPGEVTESVVRARDRYGAGFRAPAFSTVRRAPGPALESLARRKPRGVWGRFGERDYGDLRIADGWRASCRQRAGLSIFGGSGEGGCS